MDPATVERLSQIDQEIQNIDTEKAQRLQTLAAFWEHLPPIDPALVAAAMQRIRDRIRGLEERRRALLQEQRDLIVRVALSSRGGT
jgi:NAD-specific glutamate dehydrogenase